MRDLKIVLKSRADPALVEKRSALGWFVPELPLVESTDDVANDASLNRFGTALERYGVFSFFDGQNFGPEYLLGLLP